MEIQNKFQGINSVDRGGMGRSGWSCELKTGWVSSGAPTTVTPVPALEAMGCGLRKLEDPEDSSPGKIYSTLKRPQVETKTDTVYEYVLLDFSLEGRRVAYLIHQSISWQKMSCLKMSHQCFRAAHISYNDDIHPLLLHTQNTKYSKDKRTDRKWSTNSFW